MVGTRSSKAWTPKPSDANQFQRRRDDLAFGRLTLDFFVFCTPFTVAGLIWRPSVERPPVFSTVGGGASGSDTFDGATGRRVFCPTEPVEDG